MRRLRIRVPQSEGKLLAQIEARGHVIKRAFRDSAVEMEVDAPESLARVLDRIRGQAAYATVTSPRRL